MSGKSRVTVTFYSFANYCAEFLLTRGISFGFLLKITKVQSILAKSCVFVLHTFYTFAAKIRTPKSRLKGKILVCTPA